VDPKQVQQVAESFVAALAAQASSAVKVQTGLDFDVLQQWAIENDPKGWQEAMKAQAMERTTKGYVTLANKYNADLERTDPQSILDACQAAGIRARRTEGGRVVIFVPGKGEQTYSQALKFGLISVSR